jgi:2-polyprenyl-3-methyl-5-hydroxy-6-metoxy-1,4-benzoquinol methylase
MTDLNESAGFDYGSIPEGFYQQILETGSPVRRAWHLQKFERVRDCLPNTPGQSILDIGCFAGSFLSFLPEERFSRQVGIDIVEKQIAYAQRRFGTSYRTFRCIKDASELAEVEGTFDVVTIMEVVEHLTEANIRDLVRQATAMLAPNGRIVITTPNYTSIWPILEVIVNRVSEVKYEEQHITKFNYFNCISKLRRIAPELAEKFDVEIKTSTHFGAFFLAAISFNGAMALSRSVSHRNWKNPFGTSLLMVFKKK